MFVFIGRQNEISPYNRNHVVERILKLKKDYEATLARCYILLQRKLKPRTSETDELEILSILVENNEQKHFLIPAPNPIRVPLL